MASYGRDMDRIHKEMERQTRLLEAILKELRDRSR